MTEGIGHTAPGCRMADRLAGAPERSRRGL